MTKQRIIMIADKVKKNESGTVVSLHYAAIGGDNTITMVPADSLTAMKIQKGEYLCKVSEFETPGGTFRPKMVFKGDREPVQPSNELHIDLIDMVEQGAAEENLRKRGYVVQQNKLIDTFARIRSGPAIFEVKSINEKNEKSQTRKAHAQVTMYKYEHEGMDEASLWVVFSRQPVKRTWIPEYLSDQKIKVLWLEDGVLCGPAFGDL